jgi:hypothetical protein
MPASSDAVNQPNMAPLTTAYGHDGESRFHYVFTPDPAGGSATAALQKIEASAIVRGQREFKLILDFGDGSWLDYMAQADRSRCTSHEEIHLRRPSTTMFEIALDGALTDCARSAATSPNSRSAGGEMTIRVDAKTFTVDGERWKSQGDPAAATAIGPEFEAIVSGPLAALAQANPFVRILFSRVAPLYPGVWDRGIAAARQYVTASAKDCAFDERHGEPCPNGPPASNAGARPTIRK